MISGFDIYITSKIKKNFREVVDFASQHKLNIEIKEFIKPDTIENLDKVVAKYRDILEGFDGKLSMHGAFAHLNPVSDKPEKRDLTLRQFKQSVNIAKVLGVKTIVFHSGFDTFKKRHYSDPEFVRNFIDEEVEFWKGFVKFLEEADILGVIENTSEKTPETLVEIINRVNSNNLKVCTDAGHVNHKTRWNVSDWIKQTGKDLYYMHIHNNYKFLDNHNSLLRGTIDFKKVFKTLKEEHLHPGLSLEIPDLAETVESIKFIQNLPYRQ